MREFEDGGNKKDRFRDRKQARRAKRQQQDSYTAPEPEAREATPKGYAHGGGVARGTGVARRGGKYEVC